MKKILIIGKKSFIGSNLRKNLSKVFYVDIFSYENVLKKKKNFFKKYTHIINTSIHKNYITKKYNKDYDFDRKLIEKFKSAKFKYFFLNTRKIYFPKQNITENSKLKPIDNYAKNKLYTENFLLKKIKKRLISLRTSNVIGKRIFKRSRNNHKLFLDNYFKFKNQNKKIIINDDYKDFISINQFSAIIKKIINKEITGIYNVSLSQRIYISEIIGWIDKNFLNKIEFKESSSESFTLSNKKLLKKIKIKLSKNRLKIFCKSLI